MFLAGLQKAFARKKNHSPSTTTICVIDNQKAVSTLMFLTSEIIHFCLCKRDSIVCRKIKEHSINPTLTVAYY